MRHLLALALLSAALAASPALAVQPNEVLPDPALEARARQISGGLRCLVCQNQSIDESDAPLARDLRVLVRERLKAGDSDADVRTFVVSRYGDYVLLRPPVGLKTALLWGTPAIVILAGAAGLFMVARRRRDDRAAPLTAEEQAALDAVLRGERPAG